jgi:hypothetical protein
MPVTQNVTVVFPPDIRRTTSSIDRSTRLLAADTGRVAPRFAIDLRIALRAPIS